MWTAVIQWVIGYLFWGSIVLSVMGARNMGQFVRRMEEVLEGE